MTTTVTPGVRRDRSPAPRPGRGEAAMVPQAEFRSYYGQPILKEPVWKAPDIAGYLFLGGMAGGSSVVAAMSQLTGRSRTARRLKVAALGALGLGTVGLIHDLGRPARFAKMLRAFKPTSPMSVGSWLLASYGPAAGVAAVSDVAGLLPRVGATATTAAAMLGPAVAAYTAALLSDTAVPAWHGAHREMPYVFVGSAASAAGGMTLVLSPLAENQPARRIAIAGAISELIAVKSMERRLGPLAAPYRAGKGASYMKAGEALTVTGLAGSLVFARRTRTGAWLSGAALIAASACTRFGIFHAGVESARDPRATVEPQRARRL